MSECKILLILWVVSNFFFVIFSNPITKYNFKNPNIIVEGTNGHYCILASLTIKLTVGTNENKSTTISVPLNANTNGFCDKRLFQLNFDWPVVINGYDREENNQVNITWEKFPRLNATQLKTVSYKISDEELLTAYPKLGAVTGVINPKNCLSVLDSRSFHCVSGEKCEDENSSQIIWISGKYQLEALVYDDFSTGTNICRGDLKSDSENYIKSESTALAIAGSILAGVVVLTLISGFGLHYYRMSKLGYGTSN